MGGVAMKERTRSTGRAGRGGGGGGGGGGGRGGGDRDAYTLGLERLSRPPETRAGDALGAAHVDHARLRLSASIVAIGDELLAGFTLDTNSHWLAERLRLLGFPLLRMSTVRD